MTADSRLSGTGSRAAVEDILFPSREDWTQPDTGTIDSLDSEIPDAFTISEEGDFFQISRCRDHKTGHAIWHTDSREAQGASAGAEAPRIPRCRCLLHLEGQR